MRHWLRPRTITAAVLASVVVLGAVAQGYVLFSCSRLEVAQRSCCCPPPPSSPIDAMSRSACCTSETVQVAGVPSDAVRQGGEPARIVVIVAVAPPLRESARPQARALVHDPHPPSAPPIYLAKQSFLI